MSSIIQYWIYIDEVKDIEISYELLKSIHCDTRDFHLLLSKNNAKPDEDVFKLLKFKKVPDKFLINKEEVLSFLKNLETISGGRGEWRFLNFDNVDDKLGWLKYIRLYRYNDNQFIVYDSQSHAIEWRLCTKENLQSEYLNHH